MIIQKIQKNYKFKSANSNFYEKKIILIICYLIFLFNFSCSNNFSNTNFNTNQPLINKTINEEFLKEEILKDFIQLIENKQIEQLKKLFSNSLLDKPHWQNFIKCIENLNEPHFEVIEIQKLNYSQYSDKCIIINTSFSYKLYGYLTNNYNPYIKKGLLDIEIKVLESEDKTLTLEVTNDNFSKTYHIKGKVINDQKLSISDAVITIKSNHNEYTCLSDNDGEFLIEFIDSANVLIKINKLGYNNFEDNISLASGSYKNFDLVLTKLNNFNFESNTLITKNLFLKFLPGIIVQNNNLTATSYNKSIKLSWNNNNFNKLKFNNISYVIYRKLPFDSEYKQIALINNDNINEFIDENLQNGLIYTYLIILSTNQQILKNIKNDNLSVLLNENFSNILGPISCIPAVNRFVIEFENNNLALKSVGEKPKLIVDEFFSQKHGIIFSPSKTKMISFLTSQKIQSGYYKIILYFKQLSNNYFINFKIKQFGDDENKTFLDTNIKASNNYNIISFKEMFLEFKNWKNEPISSDFCEIIIQLNKSNNVNDTQTTQNDIIALDAIEFIKIE